ncbi:hypothetical protein K439DRAFT_801823 [Ramaria rubella]|nr:hypothetical protein K439DRAFT_801823 [Ramaria rubella]
MTSLDILRNHFTTSRSRFSILVALAQLGGMSAVMSFTDTDLIFLPVIHHPKILPSYIVWCISVGWSIPGLSTIPVSRDFLRQRLQL